MLFLTRYRERKYFQIGKLARVRVRVRVSSPSSSIEILLNCTSWKNWSVELWLRNSESHLAHGNYIIRTHNSDRTLCLACTLQLSKQINLGVGNHKINLVFKLNLLLCNYFCGRTVQFKHSFSERGLFSLVGAASSLGEWDTSIFALLNCALLICFETFWSFQLCKGFWDPCILSHILFLLFPVGY